MDVPYKNADYLRVPHRFTGGETDADFALMTGEEIHWRLENFKGS